MRYNKFKNKKSLDMIGNKKDSALEARHSNELILRERAKEIIGLKSQVRIPFLKGMRHCYIADFAYYDLNLGTLVIMDSKGFVNPVYSLKRSLLLALYTDYLFIEKSARDERYFYPFNECNDKTALKIDLTLNDNPHYEASERERFEKILEKYKKS